jgi:hypothetical protein
VITTEAVVLFPSIDTVIVTVPGRLAFTVAIELEAPVLTFAIEFALELHVNARPVMSFPLLSTAVAVSVTVLPALTAAVFGVTDTLAVGPGLTTIVAVPDLPPLDAVIVAVPACDVVIAPLADTAAIWESDELHVTDGF